MCARVRVRDVFAMVVCAHDLSVWSCRVRDDDVVSCSCCDRDDGVRSCSWHVSVLVLVPCSFVVVLALVIALVTGDGEYSPPLPKQWITIEFILCN